MELFFELTRRCNYQCYHCLRGDAQGIDMPASIMREAMSLFGGSGIYGIGFGGGEALLKPKIIHTFANELSWFGGFSELSQPMWIVSNGERFLQQDMPALPYNEPCYEEEEEDCYKNTELVDAVMHLNNVTPITLAISTDPFHKDGARNRFGHAQELFSRGGGFHELNVVEHGPQQEYQLLAMGNQSCGNELSLHSSEEETRMLYVNVHGDIFADCNLSYKFQTEFKDTIICFGNVLTSTIGEVEKAIEYFDAVLDHDGSGVLLVSEGHIGDLEERIAEYEKEKVEINK